MRASTQADSKYYSVCVLALPDSPGAALAVLCTRPDHDTSRSFSAPRLDSTSALYRLCSRIHTLASRSDPQESTSPEEHETSKPSLAPPRNRCRTWPIQHRRRQTAIPPLPVPTRLLQQPPPTSPPSPRPARSLRRGIALVEEEGEAPVAGDSNTSAADRPTTAPHRPTMNASPLLSSSSSSNQDRDRANTRASQAAATDRRVATAEEATTVAAVRAEVRAANSSSSVARRRHRRAINRPQSEELPAPVKVSSTNTARLARSARRRAAAEEEEASESQSREPLRPTCRRRA